MDHQITSRNAFRIHKNARIMTPLTENPTYEKRQDQQFIKKTTVSLLTNIFISGSENIDSKINFFGKK